MKDTDRYTDTQAGRQTGRQIGRRNTDSDTDMLCPSMHHKACVCTAAQIWFL